MKPVPKTKTSDVIPDPFEDRVMKDIPPPPFLPLAHNKLFNKKGMPEWKVLRDHLKQEGKIEKKDLIELIKKFKDILKQEPNVVQLNDPITIVGDVHGQFYDLLKILELGGDPSKTKYLFLGDYVDRGLFSIECVVLLMAIKINYKNTFIMLRGNHETRQMTSHFNFKHECEVKYDLSVYDLFMESFDCLPVSCVLNDKFFNVHGGISPDLKVIGDITKLNRFEEPKYEGLLCDLIWSDPLDDDKEAKKNTWLENDNRGCSYVFGAKAAIPFMEKNNLIGILRGHESQAEGFKMYDWNKAVDFPTVITIFSAPNYCDVYNNKGAIVKFNQNKITVKQYNFTQHPFVLPDYMNVFHWSIPFISEKISEMFCDLIKTDIPPEKLKTDEGSEVIDKAITNSLKMKVNVVISLNKMFKTLREESQLIMKLRGFCPGNKIPKGLIFQGPEALKTALERYQEAKKMDAENEGVPNRKKKKK
ncbi:MAG: metallophosphoesterase [archaeon]|nr:metallophosphoesterase [archaeon]